MIELNKKLIICNWKMYKTIEETIDSARDVFYLFTTNASRVPFQPVVSVIHCALPLLHPFIRSKEVRVIAQDVSPHRSGPYTGQIDAKSLRQIDVAGAMIAHPELPNPEAFLVDHMVAQTVRLLEEDRTPVIFFSHLLPKELRQDIQSPLHLFFQKLSAERKGNFIMAYEKGNLSPILTETEINELKNAIDFTKNIATTIGQFKPHIVVGGDICGSNAREIFTMPTVDGLLIGKASTQFATLRPIIEAL